MPLPNLWSVAWPYSDLLPRVRHVRIHGVTCFSIAAKLRTAGGTEGIDRISWIYHAPERCQRIRITARGVMRQELPHIAGVRIEWCEPHGPIGAGDGFVTLTCVNVTPSSQAKGIGIVGVQFQCFGELALGGLEVSLAVVVGDSQIYPSAVVEPIECDSLLSPSCKAPLVWAKIFSFL